MDFKIIAGPCTVESREQIETIAKRVSSYGATHLRGGVYKTRSSHDKWAGLRSREGIEWLCKAGRKYGLEVVTEIDSADNIQMYKECGAGIFQVGSRNANNQELLEALARADVKVLLKNGMEQNYNDFIESAKRFKKVILCARGKSNEKDIARNGQDITSLIHLINTGYPVIFDPSHSCGKREYVFDAVMGAVAMGVNGIMVEVHYNPEKSFVDGRQSIDLKQFANLVLAIEVQRKTFEKVNEQRLWCKTYMAFL